MQYFIWFNPQSGQYCHGTENKFKANQSASMANPLTLLYQLEENEIHLTEKIVNQLNVARIQSQVAV